MTPTPSAVQRRRCLCGALAVWKDGQQPPGRCFACKRTIEDAVVKAVQVVYAIEIRCLLCNAFVADVQAASPTAPVYMPSTVRCQTCGGSPYRTGEHQVLKLERIERLENDESHRRGRPPKWLVEQRRKQQAQLDAGVLA